MKLFVTAKPIQAPEGYEQVPVVYGNWDVSKVPDNACTEVIALEALDFIDRTKNQEFLKNIVSKLRRKAIMTIVGIDLNELARATHLREIDASTFNSIVNERSNISTAKEVIQTLKDFGLDIISYKTVKGMSYEIKTARKQ